MKDIHNIEDDIEDDIERFIPRCFTLPDKWKNFFKEIFHKPNHEIPDIMSVALSMDVKKEYFTFFHLHNSILQEKLAQYRTSIIEIFQFIGTELFAFRNALIDGQHHLYVNLRTFLNGC